MNLRLRAVSADDLEMIMAWRTSAEVSDYMFSDFDPDIEQQKRWYREICRDSSRLDWIVHYNDADAGMLSVTRIDAVNRRCELGYYIASPNMRSKGLGRALELNALRYVFEELRLNKACRDVLASNSRGIEIYKKYGSREEGKRRQHIRKRGTFHDVIEMGVLREEWEKSVRDFYDFPLAVFEVATKADPSLVFRPTW